VSYIIDENGNYKRTVTCGHCWQKGHNKSSCPERKDDLRKQIEQLETNLNTRGYFSSEYLRENAQHRLKRYKGSLEKLLSNGKGRKCTYCSEQGHNRRTCTTRKGDISTEAHRMLTGRMTLLPRMKAYGLGPGTLVKREDKDLYIVESIDWEKIGHWDVIGDSTTRQQASAPMRLRGFPDEFYPNGRFRHDRLSEEVTNVGNEEISYWQKCSYIVVSPAPDLGAPSDFLTISGCLEAASKLDKFSEERLQEFMDE